jgi:hypothetical protein
MIQNLYEGLIGPSGKVILKRGQIKIIGLHDNTRKTEIRYVIHQNLSPKFYVKIHIDT